MRIALGGLVHETNTYVTSLTGLTQVSQFDTYEGETFVNELAELNAVGGFLNRCAELNIEAVPTFYAETPPSGTIAAEGYQSLKARLLDSIKASLPVDAVALELHGAGVAEDVLDIETDIGKAVRALVGQIPIVVVLDLHGNLSTEMVDVFDCVLGCHEYPHTDLGARGMKAIDLLVEMHNGSLKPTTHIESLPMLFPGIATVGDTATAHALQRLRDIIQEPGIVDCTFMHGFPYADIPSVGPTVIVTTNDNYELARNTCQSFAQWIWDRRDMFLVDLDAPDVAVRKASNEPAFPVVINEYSDNPGSGCPGDSTHLLRAMLDARVTDACFASIADPVTVQQAIEAGVGREIDVHLGAASHPLQGETIVTRAYVKCVTDGRFQFRALYQGVVQDLGPTCRLLVDGVDVVVTSKSRQVMDPEIFTLHGIDVSRYRFIGLKSQQYHREGFREIAAAMVTACGPSPAAPDIKTLPRKRARTSLWPTDRNATHEMVSG